MPPPATSTAPILILSLEAICFSQVIRHAFYAFFYILQQRTCHDSFFFIPAFGFVSFYGF
jgi:hypothetical protein